MKNNLIQIRLRLEDKLTIQEAADRKNMSMSEFILRTALNEARIDNGHEYEIEKRKKNV